MQILLTLALIIFRSSLARKTQEFSVRPTNVTVIQGEDALLRCVVANQVYEGQTWWMKNGIFLGMEKSLPGYPRYQIVGDQSLGEYNFQISQVTLEDDAEYECQVPPEPNSDELRGKAYVNVLVPPSSLTFDGSRDGATIEVKADTPLDTACRSSGAKPAAQLRWLRNGRIVPDNFYTTRQAAEDVKRFTTLSRLRWPASADDNGAVFTCEAIHQALPQSKPMQSRFTVNVIYAPGIPAITGYSVGRALVAGDLIQLQCAAENGNPLPEVIWYRNGVAVGRNYTAAGKYTKNDYAFVVQSSDNDVEYRCEASNSATISPLSTSTRLKVYFPPEKVEVTGPDTAKLGDTVHYNCTSSASYPDAKLEWTVDGEPYYDHAQKNWIAAVGTGTNSWSSISFKITKRRPDTFVVCKAVNEHVDKRETVFRRVTMVVYPPESAKIIVNGGEKPLLAGTKVSLTCLATGGNPSAAVDWFKGERKITGAHSEHDSSRNLTISKVELVLSPKDNQEKVECQAYNTYNTERLSTSYTLNVQFTSDSLRITPDPAEFLAGSRSELNCENAPANPSPAVEWYRDNEPLPSVVAHNKTDASGSVIKKKLILTPSLQDNGAAYECRVSSPLMASPLSQKVLLQVHYKPMFYGPIAQTVEVLEGESISLNATAYANPHVEQYVWYKGQLSSSSMRSIPPRVFINGPIFDITNVDRNDAGNYTCKAKNRHGGSAMVVTVTVKYPAEIVRISPLSYTSVGENVSLVCDVNAYPMSSDVVKWTRLDGGGFDDRRFVQTVSKSSAILSVYGVQRDDTGEYACSANNGLGKQVTKRTTLLVKQQPMLDYSSIYAKAAAPLGKDAQLTCVADGVPDVKFSWYRADRGNGRQILLPTPHNSDRTTIVPQKSGHIRYMSRLKIKNVQESDYGLYRCLAENELGSRSLDIKFGTPEPPETPKNLQVLNRTHNSVALDWQPGFGGGLEVRFRVKYVITGAGSKKSSDPPVIVLTSGTNLVVDGLKTKTPYVFSVQATNEKGSSGFFNLTAETLGLASVIQQSVKEEFPVLIIVLICLVGILLLVLNVALVVCFLRRHRRKKLEERAANARLGSACSGRKVQMYSSEAGGVAKVIYPNEKFGYGIDGPRPHSALSDNASVRTVIEADPSCVQNACAVVGGSPHLMHAGYLLDNANEDYDSGTPHDLSYAEALRSNSLQRHLSNGVYNVPEAAIIHPTFQDRNRNTYRAAQAVDDIIPSSTPGPLRGTLTRDYGSYACFQPTTAKQIDRRYSPTLSAQSRGSGHTPYAEIRPLLSTPGPVDAIPAHGSPVRNLNRTNNGNSNFSTFAALPLRTNMQAEFIEEMDDSGDLV